MTQVTVRLKKPKAMTVFSRSSSTKTRINTEITNRLTLEIFRSIDDAHQHYTESIGEYEIDDERENRFN